MAVDMAEAAMAMSEVVAMAIAASDPIVKQRSLGISAATATCMLGLTVDAHAKKTRCVPVT
jgi:hypothetical protein